jgi:hypothetical protein
MPGAFWIKNKAGLSEVRNAQIFVGAVGGRDFVPLAQ